jgi:hypothetical protein
MDTDSRKVVFRTGREMYDTALASHTNCREIVNSVMTLLTKTPPKWNFEHNTFTLSECNVDCLQLTCLDEKESVIIKSTHMNDMNTMFKEYDLKLISYKLVDAQHSVVPVKWFTDMVFTLV